jgi:hypothetical protein
VSSMSSLVPLLNGAPSGGLTGAGGSTVGGGAGVRVARLRVAVGRGRVGVGVGVRVGVGEGVSVGVGEGVGVGVRLGVGVVVGVLVGVGVIDGVSVAVSVGTSTRIGTSLAIACTVPTTTWGLKLSMVWRSQGPTMNPKVTPNATTRPISTGRSQSCRKGSPQVGHTSRLRLLTVPQLRQRARPALR